VPFYGADVDCVRLVDHIFNQIRDKFFHNS
jgi:hypothetical protein